MRELSLHILDIVQNSIAADASRIEIFINEDLEKNLFEVKIKDDGKGISAEKLKNITDPFVTSRTTRPVGMGLALFKEAARRCAGDLIINSKPNQGTEVKVIFEHDHIDRAPLGDMKGTLISLITLNPDIDFFYQHCYQDKSFSLDTSELKKELGEVEINQKDVLKWIDQFIENGIEEIYGGDR